MMRLNSYITKANLILLIANITFLVVVLWLGAPANNQQETSRDINHQWDTEDFIRRELAFTDEQFAEYDSLRLTTIKGYERVTELICQQHRAFLEELSKDDPSQERLDSISRKIGYSHIGLKVYTARHFLTIKKICTPEQNEKLQDLIKEMLQVGSCYSCEDEKCEHYQNMELTVE